MVDYVTLIAAIATVMTTLVVLAVLWFVWDAIGEDIHRPDGDDEAT